MKMSLRVYDENSALMILSDCKLKESLNTTKEVDIFLHKVKHHLSREINFFIFNIQNIIDIL
jgi:hypothetical protein